jgi:hypothetical protein
MRTVVLLAVCAIARPGTLGAQTSSGVSFQAAFSVGWRRDSPTIAGSTQGLHVAARAGWLFRPHLRLLGELGLLRYADDDLPAGILCPQPGPCSSGLSSRPGLGITGLAAGLQATLGPGPLQLVLTGTGGGYWLYHRPSALPASAVGLRGSLGLGIQIDPRVRLLLEGGGLYFPGTRAHDATTREFGLGVMLH